MIATTMKLVVLAVTGLAASVLSAAQNDAAPQAGDVNAATVAALNDYLGAFNRGDYRRAHDLSGNTVGQIQKIRDENPKILWDQLIEERVYARVLACVPRMQRYMVAPHPMSGDDQCMPMILVNTFKWFPATAKWEVIETRQRRDNDNTPYTEAWVVVRYASPSDADQPFDGRKTQYWGDPKARFRETLLSFLFIKNSISLLQSHQRDVLYDPTAVGGGQLSESTAAAPPPPAAVKPPTSSEDMVEALTRVDQDTKTFPIWTGVVSKGFDAAWLRTNEILAKNKDKVVESNKEKGLLVTALTSHGFFKRYDKYCIVLERTSETTTRIVLKLLSYDKDYKNTRIGGPLLLIRAEDRFIEKVRATFLDEIRK